MEFGRGGHFRRKLKGFSKAPRQQVFFLVHLDKIHYRFFFRNVRRQSELEGDLVSPIELMT